MSMLGEYVKYQKDGEIYLVVKIMNDTLLGEMYAINSMQNGRKCVSSKTVVKQNMKPAVRVEAKGCSYLITALGNIFSMKTGRLMKWQNGHGIRNKMLIEAGVNLS